MSCDKIVNPPYIYVVGSLNIDFVTCTSCCPGLREMMTAVSLSVSGGKKGANQALAYTRASFTLKSQ